MALPDVRPALLAGSKGHVVLHTLVNVSVVSAGMVEIALVYSCRRGMMRIGIVTEVSAPAGVRCNLHNAPKFVSNFLVYRTILAPRGGGTAPNPAIMHPATGPEICVEISGRALLAALPSMLPHLARSWRTATWCLYLAALQGAYMPPFSTLSWDFLYDLKGLKGLKHHSRLKRRIAEQMLRRRLGCQRDHNVFSY